MKRIARRAKGFALVLALFLIVSLAAIGTYLLTVSNVQVASGILDEQGARAYQAARAGLEWGAYQVLVKSNCPTQGFTLPFVSPGFRVDVVCTPFAAQTEGGVAINTYRITATGCNGTPACPQAAAGPGYVERQLALTIAR